MKSLTSITIVVLFVAALAAMAQQKPAAGPKYDLSAEITFKGTVDEVKEVPKSCLGQTGVHLIMLTDAGKVEVQVAPVDYLTFMNVTFAKGEVLKVVASKVMLDGNPLLLAREITRKGDDLVVVRDKTGAPAWTWMKKAS
jgi:hypothetical protein